MRVLLLLSFCILLYSCGDSSKKAESVVTSAPNQKVISLPSLPFDIRKKLMTECDFIDYIFKTLPVSASFGPEQGLIANLTFISDEVVGPVNISCLPIARKMFQVKGNIEIEADVYYGEGCNYYVFIKDGKELYANKMTKEGVTFYAGVIRSVQSGAGQ